MKNGEFVDDTITLIEMLDEHIHNFGVNLSKDITLEEAAIKI